MLKKEDPDPSGFGLQGRVVIVTGAGQGLGRAFARAFAAAGARVVVAELNEMSGRSVVAGIEQTGGEAFFHETDVADLASVQRMSDAVCDRYKRVDVLVNNAGIFSALEMRPFEHIPPAEWDLVLRVSVTGAFYCSRAVLPVMRERSWGRIINIASGAVTLGRPNYLHYTTSKAALAGMTKSMARELGPSGITVNALLPGATFTEIERKTVSPAQKERIVGMQCIPRPEAPADLVGAVLFLASDHSAFMTGQQLNVDGGATHI